MFPLPRSATVARYEQADGKRAVALRPELLDNVWPKEQSAGQFTRYRFAADAGTAADRLAGLDARLGFWRWHHRQWPERRTRLSAQWRLPGQADRQFAGGTRVETVWPLVVFPIEHLGGPFREGRIEDYVPIVEHYDAGRLQAALLGELVRFLAASGQHAGAEKLAETMLARPDLEATARAEAHLMLAGDAGLAATVWDAPPPADRRGQNRRTSANRGPAAH